MLWQLAKHGTQQLHQDEDNEMNLTNCENIEQTGDGIGT